jgi:hypothetical protein
LTQIAQETKEKDKIERLLKKVSQHPEVEVIPYPLNRPVLKKELMLATSVEEE